MKTRTTQIIILLVIVLLSCPLTVQSAQVENVALASNGSSATADSEFFGVPENHLYAASAAIDGLFGTGGWVGIGPVPNVLTVTFNTNYLIQSLATYGWDVAWMTAGRVDYLNAATGAWLFLTNVSSSSSFWTNSLAMPVNARAVRLTITGYQIPGGWFNRTAPIEEFQVFGTRRETPAKALDIRVSQVELCWQTASNAWYQLQYRSTLTTNQWTPLGGMWITGNGTRYCTNDTVLVGQPQRFYQVAVTNSPPQ